MLARLVISLITCLWSAAVNAQTIQVSLTNETGVAVKDAVVMFTPAIQNEPNQSEGRSFAINQKNTAFDPFITMVPVGSTITFKNEDNVLHHVFSFSKAKRFNLKLFGAAEPQDVQFDTPGVVSIGCNIHDGMIAYVFVSQSTFSTQTDEQGNAVLDGLPLGEGVLTIWHPLLKQKGNVIQKNVETTTALAPIVASAKFRKGVAKSGKY